MPRVCNDRFPVRESKTKSTALARLLTQTIEEHKKRSRTVREKDNSKTQKRRKSVKWK